MDDSIYCSFCGNKQTSTANVHSSPFTFFSRGKNHVMVDDDSIMFEEQPSYKENNLIETVSLKDFIDRNGKLRLERVRVEKGYRTILNFISSDNTTIKANFSSIIGELNNDTIEKYQNLLCVKHYRGSKYELDLNIIDDGNSWIPNNGNSTIRISCKPDDVFATVMMDGKEVGNTPLFLDEIPNGLHIIKIHADNYKEYVEIIDSKDNVSLSICACLDLVNIVDLGLSVKWATCNIGAQRPEECGNIYAWGEIEQKETYSDINYKFYRPSKKLFRRTDVVKYNDNDRKFSLDLEDDVSSVLLGDGWHIPTLKEVDELMANCEWHFLKEKGFYVVTSKINYRKIYIPIYKQSFVPPSMFWTNSIIYDEYQARAVIGYKSIENIARFVGMPVRPVCSK